jgi:hypothetical protein
VSSASRCRFSSCIARIDCAQMLDRCMHFGEHLTRRRDFARLRLVSCGSMPAASLSSALST